MRKTTPTPQFVADRMADLDRLEREPQDSPNLTFKWRKENGREWLILRNAEGAVDFDLNCAEALVAAAYWKESAAWWKENSTGPHDFPAMESRARTPWTERTPVAVVRTLTPRMDEPPDADHAWVFRNHMAEPAPASRRSRRRRLSPPRATSSGSMSSC